MIQLRSGHTLTMKSHFLLGLKDGMGVGTDTMMPPKIGFVKTSSEAPSNDESHIHGTFPLEKILKKDPGMNAEELNRFPTQKYVEASSVSISSPFLVTRPDQSKNQDKSLLLSPFLVRDNENTFLENISSKPESGQLDDIFIPSDFFPLGRPYDESFMKEIIKKMMGQGVKISDTTNKDEKYGNVEFALQKPPTPSRPFGPTNSRFQTSFGADRYRCV